MSSEPVNTEFEFRVRPVPKTPNASARSNLAKRLESLHTRLPENAISLGAKAARAVADAVEDPTQVRNNELSQLIPIRVEGGTFFAVRAHVCSRAMVPYVVNPRVAFMGDHPAAIKDGSESGVYWAHSTVSAPDDSAEIELAAGSRPRLRRVLEDHQKRLTANGRWTSNIRLAGVRRPVTLIAVRFKTEDGLDVTRLSSLEGSTRTAEVHNALGISSADVVDGDLAEIEPLHESWREIKRIAEAPLGEVKEKQLEQARCFFVPAEIVVGYLPDSDSDFLRGVDEYLIDEHINLKVPWTVAAQSQTIGDQILKELNEQGHITEPEMAYLAGQMTPDMAEEAGFDPWPAKRAARIVYYVMRDPNSTIGRCVSRAIRTILPDKKRTIATFKAQIATTLAYRAIPKVDEDQFKEALTVLERSFNAAIVQGKEGFEWEPSALGLEDLREQALSELSQGGSPGSATIEMQVMATFVLAKYGVLKRGRSLASGGDAEDPATLMPRVSRDPRGIALYFRVLADDLEDRVELTRPNLKNGTRVESASGDTPLATAPDPDHKARTPDFWIREQFPKPKSVASEGDADPPSDDSTGDPPPPAPKLTPAEAFSEAQDQFEGAVGHLFEEFGTLQSVQDTDGKRLVEKGELQPNRTNDWLDRVDEVYTELRLLNRIAEKRNSPGTEADDEDDQ